VGRVGRKASATFNPRCSSNGNLADLASAYTALLAPARPIEFPRSKLGKKPIRLLHCLVQVRGLTTEKPCLLLQPLLILGSLPSDQIRPPLASTNQFGLMESASGAKSTAKR